MELLLPEDLIYQILLHLPVESLLQFKLVCKSWLSLIQSPNFINQHHHHHEEENLMVWDNSCLFTRDVSFCISVLSGTKFHVLENIIIDLPHLHNMENIITDISYRGVYVRLVASHNGIICLQHGLILPHGWEILPDFFLFNLATKQLNRLPIYELPKPLSKFSVTAGFGFDANTNDYKVLRMVKIYLQPGVSYESETRFEIYSLNTNSWKTIEIIVPHDLIMIKNLYALFRNGIFCWIGQFETPTPHLDVYDYGYIWPTRTFCLFDFTKEVFETMPLPDICDDASHSIFELALLRESLAFIVQRTEGMIQLEWEWSIWMLNEYGVKESWTKLYTVWLPSALHPIGFLKNEEVICSKWSDPKTELVLSNPVTHGKLEILPIQTCFQIFVYKKSLVSVKPKMVQVAS